MAGEEEKRAHRCCFAGVRPEKLREDPEEVRAWFSGKIDEAVADGYRTFICGCGMGVDLWAGEAVADRRGKNPELHLIAATPWPGFAARWNPEWKKAYETLLSRADLVVTLSENYHEGVFRERNEWMVNHTARLIAYDSGEAGGTQDMIAYAREKGLETVLLRPAQEALRRALAEHRLRYPLMQAMDTAKLVFQGMLGVGHLVASEEAAAARLREEMRGNGPSLGEALTEPAGADWFRLNLRPAREAGIREEDIAAWLLASSRVKCGASRKDVCEFLLSLDGGEDMRAAAERILDESFLPGHSEAYREAYHPSYRVLSGKFLPGVMRAAGEGKGGKT